MDNLEVSTSYSSYFSGDRSLRQRYVHLVLNPNPSMSQDYLDVDGTSFGFAESSEKYDSTRFLNFHNLIESEILNMSAVLGGEVNEREAVLPRTVTRTFAFPTTKCARFKFSISWR